MNRTAGFTFIEFLIVVLMISIVSAVASPAFTAYQVRAEMTESVTLTGPIRARITDFYALRGRFPLDNTVAGLALPSQIKGRYVDSVTIEAGVIHVKFGPQSSPGINGKIVSIQPYVRKDNPTGPIFWSCGQSDIDESIAHQPFGRSLTDVEVRYLPRC